MLDTVMRGLATSANVANVGDLSPTHRWHFAVEINDKLANLFWQASGGFCRKAYHATRSGGMVIIDDGIVDEERCQAERVLLSAVEIVNSAPNAEFYTFSQYRELLEGVGFNQVTLHGDRTVAARKGK